jgi:hypothetical protein
MTALIVSVMVAIYLAIAAAGVWLILSSTLRSAVAIRIERLLHRIPREASAFTPWGRSAPAFRWYGIGMLLLGLAVASGLLFDGPEAMICLICLGIAWIASLTTGALATGRARRLFRPGGGRIWEVLFWLPIFLLVIPPFVIGDHLGG